MSLFRRHSHSTSTRTVVVDENHPTKSTGLFGRNKLAKEPVVVASPPPTSHGLFGKKRTSEPVVVSDGRVLSTSSHGHAFSKDTSLVGARGKLAVAVKAERDADAALIASRAAVKEARQHIAALEREAELELRAAKVKADTAFRFRKAGDKLGKH